MNIAIVSGSARPHRQSHNVAQYIADKLIERNVKNWIFDVKEFDLPPLDYVYTNQSHPGDQLKVLKSMLDQTTAFIIVSPEHNGSFSGALKNSMDYFFEEYFHKPFGIVGVSSGILGGIGAVKSLQHYVLSLHGIVIPEFLLTPQVGNIFENNVFNGSGYEKRVDQFLDTFINFRLATLQRIENLTKTSIL